MHRDAGLTALDAAVGHLTEAQAAAADLTGDDQTSAQNLLDTTWAKVDGIRDQLNTPAALGQIAAPATAAGAAAGDAAAADGAAAVQPMADAGGAAPTGLAAVQMHIDGANSSADEAAGHAADANTAGNAGDAAGAAMHRDAGLTALDAAVGHLTEAQAAAADLTGDDQTSAQNLLDTAWAKVDGIRDQLNTPAALGQVAAPAAGAADANAADAAAGDAADAAAADAAQAAGAAEPMADTTATAAPTGLAAVQMHVDGATSSTNEALGHATDANAAGNAGDAAGAQMHRSAGVTALRAARQHLAEARAAAQGLTGADLTQAQGLIRSARQAMRQAWQQLNTPAARGNVAGNQAGAAGADAGAAAVADPNAADPKSAIVSSPTANADAGAALAGSIAPFLQNLNLGGLDIQGLLQRILTALQSFQA
jgi:hypothetical protein